MVRKCDFEVRFTIKREYGASTEKYGRIQNFDFEVHFTTKRKYGSSTEEYGISFLGTFKNTEAVRRSKEKYGVVILNYVLPLN